MGGPHRAARKRGDSSEGPVCLLGTRCSQLSEKWHFAALLIRSLVLCCCHAAIRAVGEGCLLHHQTLEHIVVWSGFKTSSC